MSLLDEYRKKKNLGTVMEQKEHGTVAKPADAGDLKSPPNNSGGGSIPPGATKLFLIYELNTELKEKHYFNPIEIVETSLSLEYVKNYAQDNYQMEYEFIYVEEIKKRTVVKSF